ncbi:MAG TPA: GNAT family N-acetyltransferase [Thermoanaerobaculia bacterium]|jgi:ribosomal protein S18 acetylase RimI-like enzyme|nr:GNAT family N-acetyltransferase [Thermoanaerobaculia bacterium]
MPETTETAAEIRIRPLDELDISDIVAIDEKIGGRYRPEVWERQIGYYLRRAPEASVVAEVNGKVAGFMLGEVRSGEFGLEEATGWIEVLGVDPAYRSKALGRRMAEAMLQHFRSQGAHSVRTLVDEEREDILHFFSSLGFEPSTMRPFVKRLS